jgi:hypothetical protein
MSNMQNELSPTSRAMLVGAMIGGVASTASQWRAHQKQEISSSDFVSRVAKDTLKAGAVSGVATYVAGKMAGQPVLSMFTILAAGAATVYMLENCKGNQSDE